MSAPVLVCFAVPQEAKPFQKLLHSRADVRITVTGMGSRNAERALRNALALQKPTRAFTCGFAGALDPGLRIGDVVFHTNDDELAAQLSRAGAKSVSFCCAARVAVTAMEKSALRRATNADAVEMESAVIQSVCAEAGVPCAIVRTISDLANEDLPLDFNALLTADRRLSPVKLALGILKSPGCIPALVRLGKNSAFAAEQLARVLQQVIFGRVK